MRNEVLDKFIDTAEGKYGAGSSMKAMKTVLDAAIHSAGERAYLEGQVRDSNPYAGTPHEQLWADGWLDAAMQQLTETDR